MAAVDKVTLKLQLEGFAGIKGIGDDARVPCPSSPLLPQPQQNIEPSFVTAPT